MNISVMKKSELKALSLSEIKMVLKKEWTTCIINDELRVDYYNEDDDQKQFYMDILNAYFVSSAAMELSSIDPNYPYIAKANWSILAALS